MQEPSDILGKWLAMTIVGFGCHFDTRPEHLADQMCSGVKGGISTERDPRHSLQSGREGIHHNIQSEIGDFTTSKLQSNDGLRG